MEKEIQNRTTNSSHMESLYKIELDHSKENVLNLTKELEETSQKFITTKDSLEILKNEKTKLDNKIQLQEDNIIRLNDYIK